MDEMKAMPSQKGESQLPDGDGHVVDLTNSSEQTDVTNGGPKIESKPSMRSRSMSGFKKFTNLSKQKTSTEKIATSDKIEAGVKNMQAGRPKLTFKEAFRKYHSKIILYGLMLLAYIMGGAGIFYAIEREQLSPQEYMTALYWAVVTVNTVGFGDVSPKTNGGKIFTIFFIIGSMTLVLTLISLIQGLVAEHERELMISGEVTMPTLREVRNQIYKSVAIIVILIIVGVAVFWGSPRIPVQFLDSLYLAVVTLSTVGYGDIPITDNLVRGFICIYIFIGVATFASQIGSILASMSRYNEVKNWKRLLKDGLNEGYLKELMTMDVDGNGEIDRMEFAVFYLVQTGKVSSDEIVQLLRLFDSLDEDGSGTLGFEDLKLAAARRQSQVQVPGKTGADQQRRGSQAPKDTDDVNSGQRLFADINAPPLAEERPGDAIV